MLILSRRVCVCTKINPFLSIPFKNLFIKKFQRNKINKFNKMYFHLCLINLTQTFSNCTHLFFKQHNNFKLHSDFTKLRLAFYNFF